MACSWQIWRLFESDRVYELYSGAYDKRRMRLKAYTTSDELLERAQDNDLVWLMSRRSAGKVPAPALPH